MTRIIFFIFVICFLQPIQAQEFSFQLFFTDAAGNKDTITVGYDSAASDTIDNIFGEVNIISTPINSGLDVRITNEYDKRSLGMFGTYHTKKQITFYNCMATTLNDIHIQTLDIHTNHWPVTASWDSTLFADTCRGGSLFTGMNPGGWWDVASPSNLSRQTLNANSAVTFTNNFSSPFYNDNYNYIVNQDTIPVFWLAISDEATMNVSVNKIEEKNSFKIFPNPTADKFSVQYSPKFGNIETVQIFSLTGQLLLNATSVENIDMTPLSKGIYLVCFINEKGNMEWERIIKS